jgi:hypothetical protein
MFGRKGLKPTTGNSQGPAVENPYHDLVARIMSEAPRCHPLELAAKIVGYFSVPSNESDPASVTVESMDHPMICEASHQGRLVEGLSFKFVGQRGEHGIVYLFEEFGDIAPEGNQPRLRVPVEKFEGQVRDYRATLKDVMSRVRPTPVHDVEQAERLKKQLKQFLG